MTKLERIEAIDDFWTREFAFYLHEHQDPRNRATHMVGIPILILTAIYGLWRRDWRIVAGGQVVGWAFQLAGHRMEGNRPALLKRPISFLMGPLMVLIEMGEAIGVRPAFAAEARAVLEEPEEPEEDELAAR